MGTAAKRRGPKGSGPIDRPDESTFGGRLLRAAEVRGIFGTNALDRVLNQHRGTEDVKYASRLIRNKREPGLEIVTLLLDVLDVSADYLLLGRGPILRHEGPTLVPVGNWRDRLRHPRMRPAIDLALDMGVDEDYLRDWSREDHGGDATTTGPEWWDILRPTATLRRKQLDLIEAEDRRGRLVVRERPEKAPNPKRLGGK